MKRNESSAEVSRGSVSSEIICEWSAAVSYAFRMAEPVYGIDDFPDDESRCAPADRTSWQETSA
jgi:hypothetical protein